jgi:hypothetical protein
LFLLLLLLCIFSFFFLSFSFFTHVLLTPSSLLSYPHSHTLHSPSCPILQSLVHLTNYSFCPFSSILSPDFIFHSYPPQPVTTLPSWSAAYSTNCTKQQPPAIPDKNTLYYNRNTPKHTQGPQNTATPITQPTQTLPFPPTLFLIATFTYSP